MPIEGEPNLQIVQSLGSLQRQLVSTWSLTVILQERWQTDFTSLLAVSGLHGSTRRVRVLAAEPSAPLREMFQTAVAATANSNLAVILPGDVWAPDAVALLGSALTPGGMAYADEDSIAEEGGYAQPRLKPDFSPEFLLHSSYIGRPLALSADVVANLPVSVATNETFEHDLALRASEVASSVVHVAEVLCHRAVRPSPLDPPDASHISVALARRGEPGVVQTAGPAGTFPIRRPVAPTVTASLIVAFRDAPRLLRACVDSIVSTSGGMQTELVLIDNGSMEPETASLVERLSREPNVRILTDPRPFNWAELNNLGAAAASGDILVFLNNDIEAHRDGWLQALCAQAQRPEIAAVGARLIYPDHRLQHCGVVIGLGGAAGHILVGIEAESPGYLDMAVTARECAAVTGACLATRRDVFASLDGFDESLGVDLNDIDFCLRAQRSGLRVLYEPQAELIHHESPSRGTAGDVRDIVHFIDRWETSILGSDPYLNPALTRMDASCALRAENEEAWWRDWRAKLVPNT
jgi:O-antigen biosynthesis protein